jgi:hypothetical protein
MPIQLSQLRMQFTSDAMFCLNISPRIWRQMAAEDKTEFHFFPVALWPAFKNNPLNFFPEQKSSLMFRVTNTLNLTASQPVSQVYCYLSN